jgi:hypothetical protein
MTNGVKTGFGLLLAASAGLAAQAIKPPSDLVVHEWGTFLSMSGSDGVALDGMYHEEHALPAFVHARSRDQLRLRSVVLKGETPVIYFYTEQAQKVRVEVQFPRGLWTQWYPQAQVVSPQFSQAKSPVTLRDGRIRWCADLIPAARGAGAPEPPKTATDALWNFARDVDAAFVRTRDYTQEPEHQESERFLFYRGLGEAPLRHVFLIRVEGGKGVYAYRPGLPPGGRATDVIPSMDGAKPLDEFARALADDLAARLVESGLFPKEARAMVNTWRTSYFHTEGVRALFVMPQAWTDAFIPLEVTPKPKDVVRVMVGRIELLTPERERLAARAVRDLASPDTEARGRAFAYLREQGRYVEPIVRRVLRTTDDPKLRTVCRQLLATDFVTELRAAIHSATDGKHLQDDPVFLRAQLASLLREIGLDAEAKAEGERALAALRKRTAPAMSDPESRQFLRAYARALEGAGDDQGAAEQYARFIRFGSQVRTNKDCRGCHADAGPRDMAWFRDWWAGRKFAASLARIDGLDPAIAAQEAALAKAPADDAAHMMLAYLHQAKGDAAKARACWKAIEAMPMTESVAARLPRDR